MTRFARASGSKASNKHVPEEATPWSEMRQQMESRKHEIREKKEKQKFMETRKRNYEEFLNEQDEPIEDQWADFTESLSNKKEPSEQKSGNQSYVKKMCSKRKMSHSNDELSHNINVSKHVNSNNMNLEVEVTEHAVGENEIKSEKKIKKYLKMKKLKTNATHNTITSDEMSLVTVVKEQNMNRKRKKQGGIKNQMKHNEEISNEQNVLKENEREAFIESHVIERPNRQKSNQSDKVKKKKFKIIQSGVKSDQETNDINPKGKVDLVKQTDTVKQDVYKNKSKEYSKKNNLKMKPANTTVANDKLASNVDKKLKQNNFDIGKKSSKYERRCTSIFVGGVEVQIGYYDGFPVKKDDVERLIMLKKQMISKGIPKSEIDVTMKLERRKAEKALQREKKNVCFNCRKSGHLLSECPSLVETTNLHDTQGTGFCFKCGSTEHTHFECKVVRGDVYKFAKCFICNEQGHISKQCPDNKRGLYPKGGACRVCGDVTHLKKDCPTYRQQQESAAVRVDVMEFDAVEGLGKEEVKKVNMSKSRSKIIKF